MTYVYEDPRESGYEKFKLSRREYNKVSINRVSKFEKIDSYYREDRIVLEFSTSKLGKTVMLLGFPVWVLFEGVGSIKEICEEIGDTFHEKERGKFSNRWINKYNGDGNVNKKFRELEKIYKDQKG